MTKILIPQVTAQRLAAQLNRRHFLALSGVTAAAAFLAACGGDGGNDSLKLFTWADYDDEELLNSWGDLTIDIYGSNEEAIQKLAAAKGDSGYDVVVPTGVFIPQMVREGLLEPLDLDKIPNFANLDTAYTNQDWDQGNEYSVCKDWGSTGWIYDNTIITDPIETWADFLAAITDGPAKGNASVLDTPGNLCGLYFWANGIDWTTEKAEDLDACEEYIVNTLAPNVKAYDSYPGIALTQGNYALSQAWNGDARQGLLAVEEAGDDPGKYTWALGAPVTELWMDNWCIVKGAPNIDGGHDFINFILDKDNSITDLVFHGYNTGMADIESLLPDDLLYPEMIFFDDAQVATMQAGAVNSAQDRLVEIYNNAKAASGA